MKTPDRPAIATARNQTMRFCRRNLRKARNVALFLLIVYPLAGQLPPPLVPPDAPSGYLLGPNDQIKIWVLGVEEIGDKPIRIDPGGDIDLPLVGKVQAAGLSTMQFKAELVGRFSKELLHPQITVQVAAYGSQPISVLGAVNHPGVHQVQGRKTLVEAISLADGLRADAGPRVNISRQIQYGTIPLVNARTDPSGNFSIADVGVKDLLGGMHPAENIPVYPNDVITIPTAETVYVIGDVIQAGEIKLKGDGLTVLQALSSAQGFGPTPAPQNAKIVRLFPGTSERRDIPVDLNKILAGTAEDVAMRPNDILVIPVSGAKKLALRAMEAAIQVTVGMSMVARF